MCLQVVKLARQSFVHQVFGTIVGELVHLNFSLFILFSVLVLLYFNFLFYFFIIMYFFFFPCYCFVVWVYARHAFYWKRPHTYKWQYQSNQKAEKAFEKAGWGKWLGSYRNWGGDRSNKSSHGSRWRKTICNEGVYMTHH